MTELVCEAAVPAVLTGHIDSPDLGPHTVIVDPVWAECGEPAVAVHEYTCPEGHVKRRATCPDHQPELVGVGCRDCWGAGMEVPMTFRRVE